MSKKLIWTIVIIVAVLAIVAVAVLLMNPKVENVEGTLEELMAKLYEGVPEDNRPAMLANVELTSENVASYLGTTEVSFKEALASEPMISSIPHSVVLVRLNDAKDATGAVEKIKANVNPAKWLCVEASNVIVKSKGDLVILIMTDSEGTMPGQELAPKLETNFDNL